jgi:TnsA endonuclease N terminal/TnsA endonuclease C terminal
MITKIDTLRWLGYTRVTSEVILAKRKRLLTKELALKLWKAGRGQGEGVDYKPWLLIHDVASLGLVTRIQGWKQQREHHLMSNEEFAYFYQLEWSERVVDIREQFPLWPFEETQEIAGQLGIKHPDPHRGENAIVVMTSDFRVTTADGGDFVRTVKTISDLKKRRTIEKFEIERCYWERRGVDWGIVIANEIPKSFVKNMAWLHPHKQLVSPGILPENLQAVITYFTALVAKKKLALATLATHLDTTYDLEKGSGLLLARHLIATRQWRVDMDTRINPSKPFVLLEERS